MTHFDVQYIADCREDIQALADDITPAATFSITHFGSLSRNDGGKMYAQLLDKAKDADVKTGDLLVATRKLLWAARDNCQETVDAYVDGENENIEKTKEIWSALQVQSGSTPISRAPNGAPSRGALPSTCLVEPEAPGFEHWIFQVLAWPDYLSIGSWLRRIIGWLWGALNGGEDPWQAIWDKIGGDYSKLGKAANAWGEFATYYTKMGQEIETRATIMFSGWYDSDGAAAAGGYFRRASEAVSNASETFTSLKRLFNDIAWSSYGFCQAIYSLIDALIDTIMAVALGGASLLELIAGLFTGGVTAIPGSVTAVIAIVEAASAAWGWMMTAVNGIVGLGALLGAATTDVEWATLPEG